jgi:two-component system, OmpR family, KDP operon response regulator KdpE
MNKGQILVVDDDPQIRRVMRASLTAHGYGVNESRNGEEALEMLRSTTYNLVLLDMNMPGMGGIKACRTMREGRHGSELAIIMLTVRNTEKDKIEALNAGADDYVTKPFSMAELLARIAAAMRRVSLPLDAEPKQIKLGHTEIDLSSRHATVRGRSVRLTPKEYELLSYLVAHPNRTIAHRELLKAVWGPDYGEELEYLRVFVNRLRRKIEPDPSRPRFLVTDGWSGYRFCLPR